MSSSCVVVQRDLHIKAYVDSFHTWPTPHTRASMDSFHTWSIVGLGLIHRRLSICGGFLILPSIKENNYEFLSLPHPRGGGWKMLRNANKWGVGWGVSPWSRSGFWKEE